MDKKEIEAKIRELDLNPIKNGSIISIRPKELVDLVVEIIEEDRKILLKKIDARDKLIEQFKHESTKQDNG